VTVNLLVKDIDARIAGSELLADAAGLARAEGDEDEAEGDEGERDEAEGDDADPVLA
jgi:hypothetical protein